MKTFLGVFAAMALWSAIRAGVTWSQCRAYGFSVDYCMQMVASRL